VALYRTNINCSGAGWTIAASKARTKEIKVRFEVLNGGGGLINNARIVSTQDDSYLNV